MILHMDMDAFFASVEQRDNPDLKGKPIVVSGRSRRSVVSTASYEARKYGIHSAMPVFQAMEKCPDLIVLPGSRHKYAADSKRIISILEQFSPGVEQVSIDEAYVDIQGTQTLFGAPDRLAALIKQKIHQELNLTCSVGIAPLKFLAKIASDMNKPDGLTIILPDQVADIIDTLPISKVPGIGKMAMKQMAALQIRTLGDVRNFDAHLLNRKFGKMGTRLLELARGIDTSGVETDSVRKSISSETTLSSDISNYDDVKQIILSHAQQVGRDLRQRRWLCRQVSIKLKFSDFTQITRGKKTSAWISSSKAIFQEAMALYSRVTIKKKIRLIGVGISDFRAGEAPVQMELLPDPDQIQERKWQTVDQAVDGVWKKFGTGLIQKASLGPSKRITSKQMEKRAMENQTAVKVNIMGRVQGVFFRATTRDEAIRRHLTGYVRNLPGGSVEALFQGPDQAVEEMVSWCWRGSGASKVNKVAQTPVSVDPDLDGFQVRY